MRAATSAKVCARALRAVPPHLIWHIRQYCPWALFRDHVAWRVRLPLLAKVSGLAVSRRDEIFVTEWDTHGVHVFSATGTWLRHWGTYGGAPGQFCYPAGIAVTDADQVVVADRYNNRVQVFDPDGRFVRAWQPFGGYKFPVDLAVVGEDALAVTDGFDCVFVFRLSDGAFLRQLLGCNRLILALHATPQRTGVILVLSDGLQSWGLDGRLEWVWPKHSTTERPDAYASTSAKVLEVLRGVRSTTCASLTALAVAPCGRVIGVGAGELVALD